MNCITSIGTNLGDDSDLPLSVNGRRQGRELLAAPVTPLACGSYVDAPSLS
jgi:hypothetical protein